MTREEKEKLLRIIKTPGRFGFHYTCGTHPAEVEWNEEAHWAENKIFEMIECSTETEPCSDCVSREAGVKAIKELSEYHTGDAFNKDRVIRTLRNLPSATPQELRWIPVSERLPETDNENKINKYDVLLWVKDKSHPERESQIYLGKLRHIDGDDGRGNFWGIKTKPCEWTIWGWCYLNEPEVIAWIPLPEPYEESEE